MMTPFMFYITVKQGSLVGGHYQSIRPQTCENLPKEDQNKTENKQRKNSREATYIDTTNILTNKHKRK